MKLPIAPWPLPRILTGTVTPPSGSWSGLAVTSRAELRGPRRLRPGVSQSAENWAQREANEFKGGRQMQGNVLLLSQRGIADLAAFCLAYEFEDTFAAITDAQRIDATDLPALEFSRRAYKLARLASGSAKFARPLAPYPRNKVELRRDFELFFPVFSHTYELYSLATIPNWRQRCRKAACFISEVWSDMLPEYLFELLSAF